MLLWYHVLYEPESILKRITKNILPDLYNNTFKYKKKVGRYIYVVVCIRKIYLKLLSIISIPEFNDETIFFDVFATFESSICIKIS